MCDTAKFKQLQPALRIHSLIHEGEVPRREAEDIFQRTFGLLQAWQRTKQTG